MEFHLKMARNSYKMHHLCMELTELTVLKAPIYSHFMKMIILKLVILLES